MKEIWSIIPTSLFESLQCACADNLAQCLELVLAGTVSSSGVSCKAVDEELLRALSWRSSLLVGLRYIYTLRQVCRYNLKDSQVD